MKLGHVSKDAGDENDYEGNQNGTTKRLSVNDWNARASAASFITGSLPLEQQHEIILVDRQVQEEALHQSYRRSLKEVEICLITGPSGTGKTALANTLLPKIHADGGFCVRGKFDQTQCVLAKSPIFRAFSTFARDVVARGPLVAQETRAAMEAVLEGSERTLLLELIPELAELLDPDTFLKRQQQEQESPTEELTSSYYSLEPPDEDEKDTEVDARTKPSASSKNSISRRTEMDANRSEHQGRVISVFRRFLRAISCPERPVVLILDDLQWSDDITLVLLEARLKINKHSYGNNHSNSNGTNTHKDSNGESAILLSSASSTEETTTTGALMLATCRGNEVKLNDRLAVILRRVEGAGTRITDIQVDNLSREALGTMVATILMRSASECALLVDNVYQQTQGNPFFSIQYLRSLQENQTIYQEEGKWTWKQEELIVTQNTKDGKDQIVQLLGNSLKGLPSEVKQVISVAACIGGEFSEDILIYSGAASSPDKLRSALQIAEERGLLVFDQKHKTGRFTHDKFQEFSYALIPDDEKAAFHLELGRTLRNQLPIPLFRSYFSVVIHHIKSGMSKMEDMEERENYAGLCLRAARKTGKASAFALASEYAEIGILLLKPNHWQDQYSLSLDLYNSAAELGYCVGNHKRVDELVKAILKNAISSEDKLQAHLSKVISLSAVGQTSPAITYCIEVLRRLDQPFPRKAKNRRIIWDYTFLKRRLAKISDDEILSLKRLTDPNVNAAMVFIHQLFPLVQSEQFEYSPIIAFRLVHLTLEYGLSPISSVAFAFYGAVLSRAGRNNTGLRFTRLAFRILDLYPSDRWRCRCLLISCGYVSTIIEPLRQSLQPLMTAHRLGLKSGDLESGFGSAVWHCIVRLLAGDPLLNVSGRLLQVMELCRDYNNVVVFHLASFVRDFCCSLMGLKKDPLAFVGDVENSIKEAPKNHKSLFYAADSYFKHIIATYFNRYDIALSVGKKIQRLEQGGSPIPAMSLVHSFHEGLIAAAMAQRRHLGSYSRRNFLRIARQRLTGLRNALQLCPENVAHKAYLLKAEILAAEGRFDDAMCKYEQSISYARKSEFTNEQALANEKAAHMLWKRQDSRVVPFLQEARDLYADWGAKTKVDEMEDLIAKWLGTD